jgi:hypothetical protein
LIFCLDNFSSILTTPTKEHTENSSSMNGDLLINKKNKSSNLNFQTINGNLSRLSPDLLSDGDGGGTNDADSIISIDSIKSNIAVSKFQSNFTILHIYMNVCLRYACTGRWFIGFGKY